MSCVERICDAAGDMDTCGESLAPGRSYCPLHTYGTSAPKIAVVVGVSPDAPVVVNEKGGKQSSSPYRLDLIPPKALLHVGAILKEGEKKYGLWNWKKIPAEDHINHVLVHLYAHIAGDTTDDHLGHACCRMQMALEMHLEDKPC